MDRVKSSYEHVGMALSSIVRLRGREVSYCGRVDPYVSGGVLLARE
jgi:hypothetical protein